MLMRFFCLLISLSLPNVLRIDAPEMIIRYDNENIAMHYTKIIV